VTEEDRELLLKEARLAAVHDIEMALAKLIDERGQRDPELARVVNLILYYIGQRTSEIAQDKADRSRLSRPLWS
jgi:cytochrome c oxidase assembly protein Cox11